MIRLGIAALVAVAGIRRYVDNEARHQGRGSVWWLVTAALFLLGGLAGMFGAAFLHLGLDPSADEGFVDATALLGGLAGGALVALPAWVLLRSLREDEVEETGPVDQGRRGGALRWALVALVPLALVVLASPVFALFTFQTPGLVPLPELGAQGVAGSETLTEDTEGTVLVADGGTLDCDGHKIIGTGDGVGVVLGDRATVRNCEVVGFNTAVGFGGSVDASAEQITATNNRIGFYLVSGTTGATIRDSYAGQNEIGYLFERSVTNATIQDNVAERNWGAGFQVGFTSDSIFEGNAVVEGGGGFWITDSHDNAFTKNTVSGARNWFSIGVERGSSRNVFTGNEVSRGGVGIAVFAGAGFNEFRENDLHDNLKGAHTDPSAGGGNEFVDNRAYDNRDVGLWDDGSHPDERYRGNECHGNGDTASVPGGLC